MAVELSKGLKDIVVIRDKESGVFEQINKEQELSHFSNEPVPQHVLQDGYRQAFILAADEFKLVSDCLEKVRQLIKRRRDHNNATGSSSSSSKLSAPSSTGLSKSKKHKLSTLPSSTSASSAVQSSSLDIWHHDLNNILPVGLEVAALVDKDSEPQLWILAGIAAFRPQPRPRYTVVDLDPGDESDTGDGGMGRRAAKQYQLELRKIIPLPSLKDAPLSRRREFSRGSLVLALFPVAGVTTFYKAEVVAGPRKRKDDKYTLRFDDEEEEGAERVVAAQYVAPYPGVLSDEGWL